MGWKEGSFGEDSRAVLGGGGAIRIRKAVWAGFGIRGFREPTPSGHGEVGYLALCTAFPAPTRPPSVPPREGRGVLQG